MATQWHRARTGLADYDAARFTAPPPVAATLPWREGFGAIHALDMPEEAETDGSACHSIHVALGPTTVAAGLGAPPVRATLRPGSFYVVPQGMPTRWAAVAGPIENMILLLAPGRLQALAGEAGLPGAGVPAPVAAGRDPWVEQIAHALLGEMRAPAAASRLWVDTLVTALGLHLLRARAPDPARGAGPAALSPYRVRRVVELIDARLDEDLSLADLAAASGLSPYHFARGFKRAIGLAPCRFLVERRVARAKALLAEGDLPIAEVALACGFASQQQLTETFNRVAGTTPGRFRREQRR